jgi:hypothetical protein
LKYCGTFEIAKAESAALMCNAEHGPKALFIRSNKHKKKKQPV